jgi:molybdenum cofactor cytidylyltransferase
VVVTLGHDADRIRHAVDLGAAEPVLVPDWREGQAASLRAGVAAVAADADAVVVLLGDQPRLPAGAIDRVLAARGDALAVRATHAGVPGHPVVIERALFDGVLTLRGDVGARDLLARHRVSEVEMGPPEPDVDTREQLEEMRP